MNVDTLRIAREGGMIPPDLTDPQSMIIIAAGQEMGLQPLQSLRRKTMQDRIDQHTRRWMASRCYCTRPVRVSDPSRYPHMCAKCGGHVMDTHDDHDALFDAYQRIEALERENRILRIAVLVFILIAVVAVALYDGAVTSAIGGGR